MIWRTTKPALLGIVSIILIGSFVATPLVFAQSEAERLRAQIDERNNRLGDIEAEIAALEGELQKVGAEKSTLQNAINQLELERRKVAADISYTQNKIGATDLEISKLSYEINETELTIARDREVVATTLRSLNEVDNNPLIVSLLRYDKLSDFWNVVAETEQVRDSVGKEVTNLITQKDTLEEQRSDQANKRDELVDLKDQYSDQNQILTQNKKTKAQLLEETKSEEALYQARLAEQKSLYEALLKEIRDYESQLQFILDPTTIPNAGTQVFNWPLQNILITQYFGGTEFAARNASVYGGRPYHPGVDFSAPVGTKIYAPLSGTVRATGNTDAFPGCYSWGKWTLIDHANGLSTLYAHQSVISVSPGQAVSTGDVIGYTGNTGYTTGPHLHFTVYAKEGVTIHKFNEIKAVTNCGAATTPVAATEAYLDPMNYLPAY